MNVGENLQNKDVKAFYSGTHCTMYLTTDKKLYAMGDRLQRRLGMSEIGHASEVTSFNHDKYDILEIFAGDGRKPYPVYHILCNDKEKNKKVILAAGYN